MAVQVTPQLVVSAVFLLPVLLLLGYGILQYRRRGHRSELVAFIVLMIAVALFISSGFIGTAATSADLQLLGTNFANGFAALLLVYSFVWFALAYSENEHWVNQWTVGIALGHIVVNGVAVMLVPELLYEVEGLATQGPVRVANITFGEWVTLSRELKPPFFLLQLYTYTLLLVSGTLLVRYMLRRRTELYRGQTVALAVGIGTPLVTNALVFVGLVPPELNLTTLAVGIASIAFAVAVFNYRLLRLAPVGRQQLVEILEDPVVVVDDQQRVVDCNPAARTLVDVSGNWRGRTLAEFFAPLDGIDSQDVASLDDEVTVHSDGRTHHFDVTVTPIARAKQSADTPPDETVGYTVVMRNVTELREREQELTMLQQIFARVFRHNLRNELGVSKGHTEEIKRRVEADALERSADLALQSIERVLGHAQKAREIQRVLNSDDELTESPLSELVSRAVSEHRSESGVEINTNVAEATVSVTSRFDSAIENAVENAIEHNPPPVTIDVRTEHSNGTVDLLITDDGDGIPTHEIEVLSDEEETALSHGSGVGLWLMKWHTEKSGGTFHVSGTATGTTVRMQGLPVSHQETGQRTDGEPSQR